MILPLKKILLRNLYSIGYASINRAKPLSFVKAFQRRFRQELINGKIDQECLLISKNLAKKLN